MSRQTASQAERDDQDRQFVELIDALTPHQLHALRVMMENHRNPDAAFLAAFRMNRAMGKPRHIAAACAHDWVQTVRVGATKSLRTAGDPMPATPPIFPLKPVPNDPPRRKPRPRPEEKGGRS